MVNPWRKYKAAPKRQRQALQSLVAGLALFAVLYLATSLFGGSLCPIRNLFGVSCFGCGLTRGFIAILHLDLKAATRYHVLSIPLFVGIAAYAVLCFTDILLGRNDLDRIARLAGRKYMFVLYAAVLALSVFLNRII